MSALTSLLARDAVVPVHAIEDALQKQALEGGDVDVALLELGALSENTLNAYCAATFGLTPVSREELIGVSDDTLKLVPMDLARRLRVVPMARVAGSLVVCSTRPLTPSAQRELEDAVGQAVTVRIASAARVEISLATYYGVEVSARVRALAESLEQAPAGTIPKVEPAKDLVVHLTERQRETFDSEPPQPPEATKAEQDPRHLGDTLSFELDSGKRKGTHLPHDTQKDALLELPDTQASEVALSVSPGLPSAPPHRPHSRPHFRRVSTVPKGPLSADRARQLLEVAADRDAVVDIFFSFARQYFDCSAFFAVRGDELSGLEAYGLDAESPEQLRAQVKTGGVVDDVLRSLLPKVAHLNRAQADEELLGVLGREQGQPAALIPVVMRQRVVSLLYGDRDGDLLRLEDLGELLGIVPSVVQALLRVIRERKVLASLAPDAPRAAKGALDSAITERLPAVGRAPDGAGQGGRDAHRAGRQGQPSGEDAGADESTPDMASLADLDSAEQARATLGVSRRAAPRMPDLSVPPMPKRVDPDAGSYSSRHEVTRSARPDRVGAYRAEPGREDHVGPHAGISAYPGASEEASREASTITLPEAHVPAEDGAMETISALSTRPPPHGSTRPVRPGGRRRSLHREEPQTRPVAPRSRRRPTSGTDAEMRLDEETRDSEDGPRTLPDTPIAIARGLRETGDAPPRERSEPEAPTESVEEAPPTGPAANPSDAKAQSSHSPSKKADSVKPAPLEKTPRPEAMPSIIVDMGADIDRLVEDLAVCGPDDETELVGELLKLGAAPLPALVAKFPGQVWIDRRTQHQRMPLGRDVSAIARALHAYGSQAAPYVGQLLNASSADTRFYALLLAADRMESEFIPGIAHAAFDEDPQVRILARDTLPIFEGLPGYDKALGALRVAAMDKAATVQRRLDALEALCAARDVGSFDVFVELNGHRDRQLAVPAHRALMLLTGRDFGSSARKWRSFGKQMAGRQRVEWLIDGLTQSDEHLRATAGTELQKLTQVYFGYVPSASKRERERVQRRYREWFEEQRKSA